MSKGKSVEGPFPALIIGSEKPCPACGQNIQVAVSSEYRQGLDCKLCWRPLP
jgi:hypothetical protein